MADGCVAYTGRAWDESSAAADCATLGGSLQSADCAITKGCVLEAGTAFSRLEKLADDADDTVAPSFCEGKGGRWYHKRAAKP